MTVDVWQDFLNEWNLQLRLAQPFLSQYYNWSSDNPKQGGLLCNLGASAHQIAALESRLGVRLPVSYSNFLKASNGLRSEGFLIEHLYSTNEVNWLAFRHEEWIDNFLSMDENYQLNIFPTVPDEQYFVYGKAQQTTSFRVEDFDTSLQISKVRQDCVYLLNPNVVILDNEWEAWSFANSKSGANRYRSFWEMVYTEVKMFNEWLTQAQRNFS